MRAASSRSSTAREPDPPLCRKTGVLFDLDTLAGEDEHAASVMRKIKIEDSTPAAGRASIVSRSNGTSLSAPAAAANGRLPSPASSPDAFKTQSNDSDKTQLTKPPRIPRRISHKPAMREPPLFSELADATSESCRGFRVITDCLYGSKHLGSTDHDALDCDCRDDWREGQNFACGEDSDCINRATKMECSPDAGGNCAGGCQNQRFQRKEWAAVSVIKTEMKGYGLRTDADLLPNDFIYEYIGEVISEPTFRRRMLQYDAQGIKHFYFMSLSKSEFVDATKKGNLGRFCNHSCNPNCYVDKWVVGDKLRMGIFALRDIRAGEELVFNYNVDRYGADPQPCYCGEPNCVGFIGGKTQTERATKLPAATVEALGIDDADGWDLAIAKKSRRKRPDEDDEDYVNAVQARHLDEEGARKVMAALMQCREKWIAVKLLQRIQCCEDDRVLHCVMRMHAYQILRTTLNTFIEDRNVVQQVLEILDKFPRLTRNKIQDSNIEAVITVLAASEHDDVASMSEKLLDEWSKLEVAYRIRRRKLDPNATAPQKENVYEERRGGGQSLQESGGQGTASRAATSPPRPLDAPKGPRGSVAQRNSSLFPSNGRGPPRRPFHPPLPDGWFSTKDSRGNTYFYTKAGTTTWQRPTEPAADTGPKGPSKAVQEQLAIQSIIDRVTKEVTPKQATVHQQQHQQQQHRQLTLTDASAANTTKHHKDKWRALPIDKQMKIYENTVFPPVKHVLDKFRHKLPKDELKRLGKDIAKKLVASDYKNKRVDDPTVRLSEKQTTKVKKYVTDFLNRAVEKYEAHRRHRALGDKPTVEAEAQLQAHPQAQPLAEDDETFGGVRGQNQEAPQLDTDGLGGGESPTPTPRDEIGVVDEADDDTADVSDEDTTNTPCSPDRKRKREGGTIGVAGDGFPTEPDVKKPKTGDILDQSSSPPPPPPPPPPLLSPGGGDEIDVVAVNEEIALLREQEEALMRENEEAERLDKVGEEEEGDRVKEETVEDTEEDDEDDEEEAMMGRPTVATGHHRDNIPIVA